MTFLCSPQHQGSVHLTLNIKYQVPWPLYDDHVSPPVTGLSTNSTPSSPCFHLLLQILCLNPLFLIHSSMAYSLHNYYYPAIKANHLYYCVLPSLLFFLIKLYFISGVNFNLLVNWPAVVLFSFRHQSHNIKAFL